MRESPVCIKDMKLITATLKCICNDSFTGVLRVVSVLCVVISETGQLLLELPYLISIPHQSKSLCLKFVSNQGNHSVVKTTNLFLQ